MHLPWRHPQRHQTIQLPKQMLAQVAVLKMRHISRECAKTIHDVYDHNHRQTTSRVIMTSNDSDLGQKSTTNDIPGTETSLFNICGLLSFYLGVPKLVVSNLVLCIFYTDTLLCALCALLCSCVCALLHSLKPHLRSFALICFRLTEFRTAAFGNHYPPPPGFVQPA